MIACKSQMASDYFTFRNDGSPNRVNLWLVCDSSDILGRTETPNSLNVVVEYRIYLKRLISQYFSTCS